MSTTSLPTDSVPISVVAHHAYCPRRAWLEVNGERMPGSAAMAAGDSAHRRVHDAERSDSSTLRAMDIRSEHHGFHGRIDAAEVLDDGSIVLVEYKATPERRQARTTPAMRLQLALQRTALEEMGHRVARTEVYFTTHRTRVPIEMEPEDIQAALEEVKLARTVIDAEDAPEALIDDPRCAGCSHVSLCLPDERQLDSKARTISVRNPDGQVLHLATYGAYASLSGGRIRVKHRGEEISSVPLERVQAVMVHGNVDLSSGLLRELLWRRVPVAWCSSRGRLVGLAISTASPNGAARVSQHVASHEGRIDLVREMIGAKISNQATLLRRHGHSPECVRRLRMLARAVKDADGVPTIFGREGTAAGEYFSGFQTMLSSTVEDFAADFPGRVGRGATDRLNVCLNYVYGMLLADVTRAVVACGLDPHAGFMHSSSRNKPALALDLMEEFRPVVADSVVLGAVNNREVRERDFADLKGSVRLLDPGRKALIAAYERRVTTEFTHPLFGYRVTWRRAMEIQARMVLGVLDGTQAKYIGIRVR